MATDSLFELPYLIMSRLDIGWTFLLYLTRFTAFLSIVPGLGGGISGLMIRYPAVVAMSAISINPANPTAVPGDMALVLGQLCSEALLGVAVGMVPFFIISGAQVAGGLAAGAMGLTGAQLIDPTTQTSMPDLARIYSDLAIVIFLLLGGHYVAISQLAGLDNGLPAGSFILSASGMNALIDQTARIFRSGCLLAAPVVVALLLTNFVMGVISKAVPTINIFIVSFPLTVGIGLILSILSIHEMAAFLTREFAELEGVLAVVTGR